MRSCFKFQLRINSFQWIAEDYLIVYAVADLDAERKVEILKAQSFDEIETLLHKIRTGVISSMAEDERALKALEAVFKSREFERATPDQIADYFKKNRATYSFIDVAFKRVTSAELLETLPREKAARIQTIQGYKEMIQKTLSSALSSNPAEQARYAGYLRVLQGEIDRMKD